MSWRSDKTSVYYEQHIDADAADHGRYYQAWQADFDEVGPRATVFRSGGSGGGEGAAGAAARGNGNATSVVCFRVWLSDPLTSETFWLESGDDDDEEDEDARVARAAAATAATAATVTPAATDGGRKADLAHARCMPICNHLVRFHEPAGYCA